MNETLERTTTIPEKTQERIWRDIQNYRGCWTGREEAKQNGDTELERQYSDTSIHGERKSKRRDSLFGNAEF
ncbi:MAG: hypothetical protein Q4D98_07190 [Planctomycetia bacterium]|nr:hypothetical protein [Planctomycetia bacterium]